MATFVTIGYGDESGYSHTREAARNAAHAHDALLLERGAVIGIAGAPIQVRNHDQLGVRTAEGPFMRADLPIAGFAVIEADSAEEAVRLVAEEAVRLVAETPCAIAYGVVEVWPLIVPLEN